MKPIPFTTKHGGTCTLSQVEFLQRLLWYVLPKGFHKIRHYGLASASHVQLGTLACARALLLGHHPATTLLPKPDHGDAPQTWLECLLALTGIDALRCQRCETGRLTRQPLPDPRTPILRDTS